MRGLLADAGMRSFLKIWAGLSVSVLGSTLTAFALGIWIFQKTASTSQYAIVMACAAVPPIIVLPLAGPIIDRVPRRRLLILCDVVGALGTAAVAYLSWTDSLTLLHACWIVMVIAAASALQVPTYGATMTVLVPADQLGRANGLTQLAQAASHVAAPLLAGVLVLSIGLAGIAAIDLVTFAFSTVMLLLSRVPDAAASTAPRRNYWREIPFGWQYVLRHSGLLVLLIMFVLINFLSEVASVLFTPFVLTFSDPAALGAIVSVGGIGMLAGGAVMTLWGGPRRPALGAALLAAASGIAILSAGFTVSIPALAAIAAGYFFFLPLLAGSSQVVWQRVVPADIQGRVFAARAAIAMSAAPLAPLVAGPAAERFFEPAMADGGRLAGVLGPWIGTGPGRGIAVLFVLAGLLSVGVGLAAAGFAPLRRLDRARPDAAGDSPVDAAPDPVTPAAPSPDSPVSPVSGG